MDKVYIVTSGDYSAYHIERVFQSKEKAEAYVRARNNLPGIETFEYSDDCINKLTVTGKFLSINQKKCLHYFVVNKKYINL